MYPNPYVAFEHDGATAIPLRIDMLSGMVDDPRIWIRDTYHEAYEAAKRHEPRPGFLPDTKP